jgi:hypothetical protein
MRQQRTSDSRCRTSARCWSDSALVCSGLQSKLGLLRLGLSVLLAVQVLDTRYGVETEEGFQSFVVPWRIQPGVRLELSSD